MAGTADAAVFVVGTVQYWKCEHSDTLANDVFFGSRNVIGCRGTHVGMIVMFSKGGLTEILENTLEITIFILWKNEWG